MAIKYSLTMNKFDCLLGRSPDGESATPLTLVLRICLCMLDPVSGHDTIKDHAGSRFRIRE